VNLPACPMHSPTATVLPHLWRLLGGRAKARRRSSGPLGYVLGIGPALVWMGAVPVFCESEPERLGLDPADLERKLTARTKAIVVVHLWGLPSKMTEILAFARKHGLKIIEDASHAQGATWRGQGCGTLGDVSVLACKVASWPGRRGWYVAMQGICLLEQAVCFGDITRIIQLETPARRFAATSFGIKTRIAPVSAAIARNQLARLEQNNKKRNANLAYLSTDWKSSGSTHSRAYACSAGVF